MKTQTRLTTAFRIWIVIYPSITIFLGCFGPALSPLPLYQRTLILTLILVPWTVFIGLPVLTYATQFFSSKDDKES